MQEQIKKRERNSNLELLRILCILFIIADHFSGQGGIPEGYSFGSSFFYCALTSLSRVGCSVFIIICAWFSVDSTFKFKRVAHVWLTVSMYTVPIMLYCLYIGIATKNDVIIAFFPIEESPLWFAGYYIILVLMTPVLNRILISAPKRLSEYTIAVLFVLCVLYPTLTTRLGFFAHDIWAMVFIYLLTGYIKKHTTFAFSSSSKSFCLFITLWLALTVVRAASQLFMYVNPAIFGFIATVAETYRARMQTIPNLLMAYSLFFCFKNLKINNSRIINKLASATLGVYVYHQIPCWYMYMWKHFYRCDYYTEVLHGAKRMLYAVISILIVWVIGTIIELMRIKISYLLIESREKYLYLCSTIDDFINEIGKTELQSREIKIYTGVVIVVSVYYLIVAFCYMVL